MVPIRLDEFLNQLVKVNSGENKRAIRQKLMAIVEDKQNGATCIQCGNPIWAIGSAVVGWNGCFTCITGEANSSDDYEIDVVCWSHQNESKIR